MIDCFVAENTAALPIIPLLENTLASWSQQQSPSVQNWLQSTGYKATSGARGLLCTSEGHLEKVIVGMNNDDDWTAFGQLATNLPKGIYRIEGNLSKQQHYQAALAWGLGAYQFSKYKSVPEINARLALPSGVFDSDYLNATLQAVYLVRDLINTPTDDMTPADLGKAAEEMAGKFGAEIRQIVDKELLSQNYPSIYTVGRASVNPPRLIDLRWGNPDHPKITLVGKGVCFDSGGLDIKNASGMALMKKDMAGAAHALGLAHIIMAMGLGIRLRVLIPAVENAVSGNAYRPGDVITSRKGLTVEITNTDAEGRVVLSDALYEAATEKPELIIDFASLTGAARVALGTDISALFTNNDALADDLLRSAVIEKDPMWRLPLYAPYKKLLDSKIATMNNSSSSGFGGAITAALFLNEFVSAEIPWAHFDIMAWNTSSRPAAPEGGEAMALRAVAHYLFTKYGG